MGLRLFCQPLALVTKAGRRLKEWFSRLLYVLQKCGITMGPMIVTPTPKGKAMSIAKMDAYFIPTLLAVQQKFSHIIPDTFDVAEEYSVYRSLRRGATLEALNSAIPEAIINMNNKWRKKMQSKGSTISMPMIQRYADAEVCVPILVQLSFLLPG